MSITRFSLSIRILPFTIRYLTPTDVAINFPLSHNTGEPYTHNGPVSMNHHYQGRIDDCNTFPSVANDQCDEAKRMKN